MFIFHFRKDALMDLNTLNNNICSKEYIQIFEEYFRNFPIKFDKIIKSYQFRNNVDTNYIFELIKLKNGNILESEYDLGRNYFLVNFEAASYFLTGDENDPVTFFNTLDDSNYLKALNMEIFASIESVTYAGTIFKKYDLFLIDYGYDPFFNGVKSKLLYIGFKNSEH
jgi:hypothetical protein